MAVHLFNEGVEFKINQKHNLQSWLIKVAKQERHTINSLNYIFCSDEHLLKMNIEYLNHNTYTDVISFDSSEEPGIVEGDIFISIDRVKENAIDRNLAFQEELDRVMVHGLLHFLGYNDKTKDEIKLMREKEEAYLSLRT